MSQARAGPGHQSEQLARLARSRHVEPSYVDAAGQRRSVSDESLLAVLQALGEPVDSAADAATLLEAAPPERGELSPPPVVVAWDGELPPVPVGPEEALGALRLDLALEGGGEAADLLRLVPSSGQLFLSAAARLPFGVHELALVPSSAAGSDEPDEVTVISAPRKARPFPGDTWALFAPLYALTDERSPSHGDLTALVEMASFAGRHGAGYVATLPLLAAPPPEVEEQGGYSPYSPLSRMWWDETYLDWRALPEAAGQSLPLSRQEAEPARLSDRAERRRMLEPLLAEGARLLAERGGERLGRYEAFVATRPDLIRFSGFRAALEVEADRSRWPSRWRGGLLDEPAVDPAVAAAHAYAQFAFEEQLAAALLQLRTSGTGIVFDLPVSCRPDGFDPWAYPGSFASGASIGAPPDAYSASGQDWGLAPLHPEGARRSGHEVLRLSLSHLLRHAAAVRIDHAMGLGRLWWVPAGMPPSKGAYVRYPVEEMMAVCCLEAFRHDASLVGEDLGTVEEAFRGAMAAHSMAGMDVAIFDLESPPARPAVRKGAFALVDTHDTATFAGWFGGDDVAERRALGILDEGEAGVLIRRREEARDSLTRRLVEKGFLSAENVADPVGVHAALLLELAASEAAVVVVNAEDLLGQTAAQNIPGTTTERSNFANLLPESIAELEKDEPVLAALSGLDRARRERRAGAAGGNAP